MDAEGKHLHIVYGQGNYTAPQAEVATVPASLPPVVANFSSIMAKIICQEGTDTLTITYPWTSEFRSSLAVDHNVLANLTTGDVHTQYFLVAGETTDAQLHSGADLIVYSDAGSTEKARIDGATGNITTSGTVDGRDVLADGTKLDNVVSNTQAITHAITDNKTVTVDGSPSDGEYVRWTANGIEGIARTGTTLPASPETGELFVHAPTGRTILYGYNGSSWIPIISTGTMTLYVDKTDGTDQLTDHGTGVDGDAFATVQYAIDCIPGSFGENVTININGETYAENIIIGGKTPTGNYTISLQGATPTVLDSQAVGAVAQGSVFNADPKVYTTITRKVGTWTANEYQNKWVRMTSGVADDEYFIIDSHTTTVLTLVGRFYAGTPSVDDTFNIEEPDTQVSNFTLRSGQINVRFYDIDWYSIPTTGGYVPFPLANECELHRCRFECGSLTSLWFTGASVVEIDACYIHNIRHLVRASCFVTFVASKVMVGIYGRCVQADASGTVSLASTVIDANSVGGSRAVYVAGLGYAIGNAAPKRSTVSLTSNIVRNAATGVDAVLNGVANVFVPANDTYVTFVNNTADTATATGGQIA